MIVFIISLIVVLIVVDLILAVKPVSKDEVDRFFEDRL